MSGTGGSHFCWGNGLRAKKMEKTKRNLKIALAYLNGETLEKIGNRHRLTKERVRQIVQRHQRREGKKK